MAVILDYGILGQLSSFFLGLLIFLVTYGLLRMTDRFNLGDKGKGIYALLALVIAFLLMISDAFVTILSVALPWYAVMIMVIFFLLFFGKIADPDGDPTQGGDAGKYIFIALFLIISVFAVGQALGPTVRAAQDGVATTTVDAGLPEDTFVPADQATTTTTESTSTAAAVIFHPNVLGMLFVLLIAMTAMFTITRPISLK